MFSDRPLDSNSKDSVQGKGMSQHGKAQQDRLNPPTVVARDLQFSVGLMAVSIWLPQTVLYGVNCAVC
jgi:hypothetical protein